MISFKKMCEDAQMYSADRYVAGIASRDLKSNPVSLADLYGRQEQYPNKQNVARVTPSELTNIIDQLGQLYLVCENLFAKYNLALNNPTIKNKALLKLALLIVRKMYDATKKLAFITRKVVDS